MLWAALSYSNLKLELLVLLLSYNSSTLRVVILFVLFQLLEVFTVRVVKCSVVLHMSELQYTVVTASVTYNILLQQTCVTLFAVFQLSVTLVVVQ